MEMSSRLNWQLPAPFFYLCVTTDNGARFIWKRMCCGSALADRWHNNQPLIFLGELGTTGRLFQGWKSSTVLFSLVVAIRVPKGKALAWILRSQIKEHDGSTWVIYLLWFYFELWPRRKKRDGNFKPSLVSLVLIQPVWHGVTDWAQ
jgi:hypothetical protein